MSDEQPTEDTGRVPQKRSRTGPALWLALAAVGAAAVVGVTFALRSEDGSERETAPGPAAATSTPYPQGVPVLIEYLDFQ